ncbi:MAG TPA: elongation factor P--(R)-beta-lysine ligase [Aquificaceae bacterium]|nr:elongation factor P--(R)-beta-lysine ligase [Aquificaceae bacterium]
MLREWSEFINKVREFFLGRGYLEVSTPILLSFPNLDSNVEPISVSVRERGKLKRLWLQTSPEYSMKKLLSKYGEHMFQIAKVFRNDEWGRFHRIEFHMLEFYRVGADYNYLMEELGDLLAEVLGGDEPEHITVEEAFRKYFGEPIPKETTALLRLLREKGIYCRADEDWETLFYRALIEIEQELGREKPTFLRDYPASLCALAKVREGVAERFELFIEGVEIANGWTEEIEPAEVRRRLMKESVKRKLPVDEEFIKAHESMPKCAGCSVGLDRLFMFYIGKDSLEGIELLS